MRGLAVGFITATAAALALVPSPAAGAFAGHEYSIVYETSGGTFVGVHVVRQDRDLGVPAGMHCTSYFGTGSNAVYQTQWVLISADARSWEELGTADQCNDFDYLYWGYGVSGVWHPLGEGPTPGGAGSHTFQILRAGASTWNYYVDGSVKGSDTWGTSGVEVSAGLESYADMLIASQSYGGLEEATIVGGGWHSWAGEDAQGAGTDMCGRWASASDWLAAEQESC